MAMFLLSLKSLWNRRVTALLTIAAIAVSVTLLLGVEKIRTEARNSFTNTVSGIDMIVGARTGPIQLLLYSVFRMGNATNNISWESYQDLAQMKPVAWTIPMSLGDSHRGYRVLGTNNSYFDHYKYGRGATLQLADMLAVNQQNKKPLNDLYDTVLGAEVAKALGYEIGDAIIVSHGLGDVGFANHENTPFRVAAILKPTGTPVDRTVHVSLEGITAMHVNWQGGAQIPGQEKTAVEIRDLDLTPKAITAVLVGLKSKFAVFGMQRWVNTYPEEPLLAILPGVALHDLWRMMGTVEKALSAISILVVVTGLLGMLTMLLSSLEARRREIAILRSVGARPVHIFILFVFEAVLLTVIGAMLGTALLYGLLGIFQPFIESRWGLSLAVGWPSLWEGLILCAVVGAGLLAGAVPAYRAYRKSLSDGMMPRL